jgi:energy-coupling factor transporter ATP-binding protein EcfA2
MTNRRCGTWRGWRRMCASRNCATSWAASTSTAPWRPPPSPLLGRRKGRLALALIVWQRPNLLLLDEPTNHLDLETREALTMALAQFEGTLVLVSHDRHLLRATTDQFLIVADGKLQPFDGDLDDYKDWLFKTKLAARNDAALPRLCPRPASRWMSPGQLVDRKEQKRLEAEQRQKMSALKKPIETAQSAWTNRSPSSTRARATSMRAWPVRYLRRRQQGRTEDAHHRPGLLQQGTGPARK